jgi:hypothetical protein
MNKLFILLFTTFLFLTGTLLCVNCTQTIKVNHSNNAPTSEIIWKKCLPPSVVVSILSKETNKRLSRGTATLIRKFKTDEVKIEDAKLDFEYVYMFLTAAHVLEINIEEIFEIDFFNYNDKGRPLYGHSIRENKNNQFYVMTNEIDVAVLCLTTDKDIFVSPVQLVHESESNIFRVGQRIYGVGSPGFSIPSFRRGMVSLVFHDRVIIDMGVAGGASGGAIFNEEGEMIAILCGSFNQFMASVISMHTVYNFMREHHLVLEGDMNES